MDGTPGSLAVADAHASWNSIRALAVVEHDRRPVVVSGGDDGAMRSWEVNGSPGPIAIDRAHSVRVGALQILERGDEAPLIVSAGFDGALRSWRLNGTPGPLTVDNGHRDWIRALVVVKDDGGPLIVSA